MEFAADDAHPLHNEAMNKDKDIVLVCAAGGMAALTGKTLTEMGYTKVHNVGGIGDWINAGGETDHDQHHRTALAPPKPGPALHRPGARRPGRGRNIDDAVCRQGRGKR